MPAEALDAAEALEIERTEFDLDNPIHAVEWILSAFAPNKRSELKPLAEFTIHTSKAFLRIWQTFFTKK